MPKSWSEKKVGSDESVRLSFGMNKHSLIWILQMKGKEEDT